MATGGTCRGLGVGAGTEVSQDKQAKVRDPAQAWELTVWIAVSKGTQWAFWVL